MKRIASFIDRLIDAAQQHGEKSEPDMEVGDLQIIARKLWRTLTANQRLAFSRDDDMNELIISWRDEGST